MKGRRLAPCRAAHSPRLSKLDRAGSLRIVAGMRLDPVVRAALFPMSDIPAPPAGHPDRMVEVAGVRVFLGDGLPEASVFPERIRAAELPNVVGQVRELLRAEGRTRGVWFVSEAADPPDLAERLQEAALTRNDEPPSEPRSASMLTRTPPPTGPPDIDAHRAETFEEFRAAFRVAASAFGVDAELTAAFEARAERVWPFQSEDAMARTIVATINGEVVGFGEATFGSNAVYLGGSGTHPDYRGRGVYRSIVKARWDAAVAHGTPALTVGAGEMSRPILERLGFSIVGWETCLKDDLDAPPT